MPTSLELKTPSTPDVVEKPHHTQHSPISSTASPIPHVSTDEETKKLLRKLDMRVLPALFILWFLSFIDRVNIGMARLGGMEKDLHMAGNDFNIAMIIFFPPFILMEVPMNLILKKVSPGIWLPTQNFLLGEPYISLSRMKRTEVEG